MIKQLSSADLVLPEDFVTSTSNDDEKWEPIVRRSEGHDGLQKEQHEKLERIALCLAGCGGGIRGDVGKVRSINLWELRQLALSNGGLIDEATRRRAWPILTGAQCTQAVKQIATDDTLKKENKIDESSSDFVKTHRASQYDSPYYNIEAKEMDIIRRDVGRSVWHTENASRLEYKDSPRRNSRLDEEQQNTLLTIICSVLSGKNSGTAAEIEGIRSNTFRGCQQKPSQLHYYQGFHDICALFRINLQSPTLTSDVTYPLTECHLRDAMQSNFSRFVRGVQIAFWTLLYHIDGEMENFLFHSHYDEVQNKLETPVSIISWTMTWFISHVGNDIQAASRLVDAFLSSHALFPLYVAVAIILHPMNRNVLLTDECECDFAVVHMKLAHMPRDNICSFALSGRECISLECDEKSTTDDIVQQWIDRAISYMRRIPPLFLVKLSKSYRRGVLYRGRQTWSPSDIAFFRSPLPQWSVASCASTDSSDMVEKDGGPGKKAQLRASVDQLKEQSLEGCIEIKDEKKMLTRGTNSSMDSSCADRQHAISFIDAARICWWRLSFKILPRMTYPYECARVASGCVSPPRWLMWNARKKSSRMAKRRLRRQSLIAVLVVFCGLAWKIYFTSSAGRKCTPRSESIGGQHLALGIHQVKRLRDETIALDATLTKKEESQDLLSKISSFPKLSETTVAEPLSHVRSHSDCAHFGTLSAYEGSISTEMGEAAKYDRRITCGDTGAVFKEGNDMESIAISSLEGKRLMSLDDVLPDKSPMNNGPNNRERNQVQGDSEGIYIQNPADMVRIVVGDGLGAKSEATDESKKICDGRYPAQATDVSQKQAHDGTLRAIYREASILGKEKVSHFSRRVEDSFKAVKWDLFHNLDLIVL